MKLFLFPSVLLIMLVLKHNIKKADTGSHSLQTLLEKETEANKTRKKDVSNLPYISIPKEQLPFGKLNPAPKEELQLLNLMDKKILNLNGITNTELKQQYGPANLEFLSLCDENFTILIRSLNDFAKTLYDNNMPDDAKTVLEYSIDIGSDIRNTYQMLTNIYSKEQDTDALQALRQRAEQLTSLSAKNIVEYIDTFL